MSFSTLTPQTPQEPRGFWHKLQRIAQYASRHLLEISLLLYFAAQQPSLPRWEKLCIYSALLYFITPMDAIPDVLPLGLTDDLTVLSAILAKLQHHITNDIRRRVTLALDKLLGVPTAPASGGHHESEL